VKDPKTAELLADIDHPYAGKRPPIDTDYFETFNRDNVSLIDVRSDPIEAITPTGTVLTTGRAFDLDTLVFATGFDAMTGPLLKLNIVGRGGRQLKDHKRISASRLPAIPTFSPSPGRAVLRY
jgi:cation diffusion facilitator CzcD-associated flavoprotein CzcO